MKDATDTKVHSPGWIFQAWASFIISMSATSIGIIYLPVDAWVKSYLGLGFAFTVSSTISVSKTVRDMHEARKLLARVDEARVERLLADHHPLK